MSWKILVVLLIGFLAWGYQAFYPPPARKCDSPGGPPVTGPRIKLRDGRYLAYKEHGVPKETAKFKIILIHGYTGGRHDASFATSALVEELGIYFVSFDRAGYGESDPDPKRTMKSTVLDIEELGEQLQLGDRFYVIGISMGGQVVWGCLKYIPYRLAGAVLVVPVINYWWSGLPVDLSAEAYNLQPWEDQWALRVAHYAPWLVYWWNTQKWFPSSSVTAGKPNFLAPDLKLLSKSSRQLTRREYASQQGVFESFHRDMMIAFGRWEFSPLDLENPFPNGEGAIHLWQGAEDGLVPVSLQRYIAGKLPWVKYHEVPDAGHLFAYYDSVLIDSILKALLIGDE